MSGREHAERLWSNIVELGPRRIAALGVIGLVVFLAVGLGAYYLSRPAQETLYTGLNREDVGRIGATLKDAGIRFDVSADGTAVLVAYGHTAQARMLLAGKGLPQSSKSGYELFNDLGSLGLTSFMQEVTRVRALEGELARTIQSMKGVRAARVHIVLPDRGSFRRDQQPPSASVVLRTEPADDVSGAQAIRHLVASAVPGMKPDRVTVIGSDGALLLSGDDETSQPTGRMASLEKTVNREIQDNLRRTLTPYLGIGNFEVSVAARLNTDKTSTNETIFNPDGRVERSVRAVRESENSQNRNSQRPTSAQQNLPDQRVRSDGNDSSSNESQKREDLTNYDISSKTIQTISDGYDIRRISVAVLVNRSRLSSLAGPDAGKAGVEAQIAEIEQLVASAAGFSKERGDVVKVAAVGFVNDGAPLEPVAPLSLSEVLMRQSATLINAATILVVAALLIWFGLRPALRAILAEPTAREEALALAGPAGVVTGGTGEVAAAALGAPGTTSVVPEVPALAGPGAAPGTPAQSSSVASPIASLLDDWANKANRTPQKKLEQMIDLDEEQAATILKRWLLREEPA